MYYLNSTPVKIGDLISTNNMNCCECITAYRVPDDAETAVLLVKNYSGSDIIIKSGDNVFRGKDMSYYDMDDCFVIFLDLNTFIQRSGEQKGCIVLDSDSDEYESKLFVLEK